MKLKDLVEKCRTKSSSLQQNRAKQHFFFFPMLKVRANIGSCCHLVAHWADQKEEFPSFGSPNPKASGDHILLPPSQLHRVRYTKHFQLHYLASFSQKLCGVAKRRYNSILPWKKPKLEHDLPKVTQLVTGGQNSNPYLLTLNQAIHPLLCRGGMKQVQVCSTPRNLRERLRKRKVQILLQKQLATGHNWAACPKKKTSR